METQPFFDDFPGATHTSSTPLDYVPTLFGDISVATDRGYITSYENNFDWFEVQPDGTGVAYYIVDFPAAVKVRSLFISEAYFVYV